MPQKVTKGSYNSEFFKEKMAQIKDCINEGKDVYVHFKL